jgi:IclR family KDG regulon transcriptional repressor
VDAGDIMAPDMTHETKTTATETVDTNGPSTLANGNGGLGESPIGTLERGLLLLELFDADNSEMSLNDLRERADLPKATIQRLMKTLEARKWVTYEPASRKYHLGASVLRISYLAASHSELVRITHPVLVKLAEETRETASLCVWTDLGPLMLDTVLTPHHFKPATNVGMILGLASADAQVLVAFGPEEAWDRLLPNAIERRTELTVTDPVKVRERWQTVRQEGVAFDRGEWFLEIPAVAVPVCDHQGQIRGSIAVAPPVERATEEAMLRHAEALKAAAAEISKKLV